MGYSLEYIKCSRCFYFSKFGGGICKLDHSKSIYDMDECPEVGNEIYKSKKSISPKESEVEE